MGRFYKTSNDTPVDYMYKIDTPLMEKVLASNDAGITQALTDDSADNALKNFKYITSSPEDAALAQQESKKIQDQTTTISKNIQGDYANWKRQLDPLRTLKQQIADNYTSGPISKLQANYQAMQTNFGDIDKQVALYNKTGGVDKQGNAIGVNPIKAQMAKAYALKNYQGAIDSTTGAHMPFQAMPLMGDVNFNKVIADQVSKIKDNNIDTETSNILKGQGGYFDDVEHKWKGVSDDKILQVALSSIVDNPAYRDNIRQMQQIGYINNAFNSDGSFRAPFSVQDDSQIKPDEQNKINTEQARINVLKRKNPTAAKEAQDQLDAYHNQIKNRTKVQWDEGSFLTPYLKDAMAKYDGIESVDKNKLRNNSFANLTYSEGEQNWRQKQQFTEDNLRDKNKYKQQEDMAYLNHDFKLDEIAAKGNAAAKKLKGGADTDGITTPTILANPVSNPYAYMGLDSKGNDDPNAVTKNFNDKITANGKELMSMYSLRDSLTAKGDEASMERAQSISNQISAKLSEQMDLNQRSDIAKDNAVKTVVPKADQDLYTSTFEGSHDNKYMQHAIANKDNFLKAISNMPQEGKSRLYSQMGLNDQTGEDFVRTLRYKDGVDKEYKNQLLSAVKETSTGTTEVGTTHANNDFIREAVTARPQAFRITDPTTGAEIASFADGKTDINDKDFKIIGAGPANNAETNTMNIYGTYKGKNVVIVPLGSSSDIIKDHLMTDWMKSGDPGVKQLTKTWSSPYFAAINKATTDISITDKSPSSISEAKHPEITLPTGRAKLEITKVGTDGYSMKIDMTGNGDFKAVPNLDDNHKKIGNYFTSNADMVRMLDMIGEESQKSLEKK